MTEILTLTPEMVAVLGLLGLTIVLFAFEILRVDVAAVLVMLLLGLLTLIPGLEGLADRQQLFAGFASSAVISIIAVMIIGAGLDKTGLMSSFASFIMKVGGSTERCIIPLVSGSVGIISGFMQNVGAAALFLPVVSRISVRTHLPMSRLVMPMGFSAILGGTLTMVGSSPLILLNDLLPKGMEPFGLFDVTPIGVALLATGILYFVLFGRLVLPAVETKGAKAEDTMAYFARVYGLTYQLREMRVPQGSSHIGQTVGELERTHRVRIVASSKAGDLRVSPHRDTVIEAGMDIAVMGKDATLSAFAAAGSLEVEPVLEAFADALAHTRAGVSEVVLPPNSSLIGKTVCELWMRKTYGLSVLAIHRGGETISEGVRDLPLQAGDTLVSYSRWEALARLEQNPDFVVVTTEYPHEELRPQKVGSALVFFLIALGLILFTGLPLAISLLVGAVGMIITGVLTIDEAYQAVSWKTVFLLASLIPLGAAVQDTGTAAWIAQEILRLLGDVEPWVMQAVIAVLATFFTLVMSNVGATVLLVPLAVGIALAAQAQGIAADPRAFALTVAIASSNSFIIPTHQVNALLMGPGGYRVKDFMRAGGIMTVLFLVVSVAMLNLVF